MKKKLLILIILTVCFPLFTEAQYVSVKKVDNSANYPMITWFTVGEIDTTAFQIYRTTIKEIKFKPIKTIHSTNPAKQSSDTSYFYVTDTTLTKKGIYLYYIKIAQNGREVISETALGHNFGYIPSPQVISFHAIPLTDRKAVKLEWEINSSNTISSLQLYRSKSYDTGYIKIADLAADMHSFTDVIPLANEPWFYFLMIQTYFGNHVSSVRIPAFATFAEKPYKPYNLHGTYQHDSIILGWTKVGQNIIGYKVYRSIGKQPFRLITEMEDATSNQIVFDDLSDAVKNNVRLRYFVRNVSDGFVESTSSDTLSFYLANHESVLPPSVVDYIFDNKGNPKFLWVTPKKGLTTGYNIYLINQRGIPVKLNDTVLTNNFFVDTVYRGKGKYTYKIEGVGYNGKTSKYQYPVTIYRYNTAIHIIINLKKYGKGIQISWKHPLNTHIKEVLLYRQSDSLKPVLLKKTPATENIRFTDINVTEGKTYLYKLTVIMADGEEIQANNGVQMRYK